ncbi:MAG TPA: hypothetical protein VHB77_07490, partial [Planctomycetaceae bacterium]|nr:hypothetical protein [Planctomycetaceae bacterium]
MSLDQAEPRRSWRTALCWLALALCAVPLGCGKSGPPPEIVQARELLQVNKFQAAADLLANQKSAEGLYLKAVALHALRQPDAALDAVKKAHQLDQADPRYEGFLLLLRMMKDEQGAANELIDLYEQNRSVGALALFASSAYLMKRDQPKSMATFDVAVALANETPEFMWQMLDQALAVGRRKAAEDLIDKLSGVRPKDPDVLRRLLQTAVRGRLGPSAETLLTKLKELTPDDPQLEKKRVEVLFLLNRPEALTAAEKLYRDWAETEEAALVYILPLSEAPYSPENDRQFAAL